jgi:uncharacterized protein (TIGR00725 family)
LISIGVFGSSLPREGEPAYEEARRLGSEIAARGGRVVCGGYGGVMEAVCRGAADQTGHSVGVIFDATRPNPWVSEVIIVRDRAERLSRLRDSADAWVFMPHGLGTMLELVWIGESVVKGDASARLLVLLGDFWRRTLETMLEEAAGPGREAFAESLHWAKSVEEAVALGFGRSLRHKV